LGKENPNHSAIDPSDYSEAIKSALNIRGAQQMPNEVDIDSIKLVADPLQAGFARYQSKALTITGTLIAGLNSSINIFSPTSAVQSPGTPENPNFQYTRLHEIRLIGLRAQLGGITSIAGDSIKCSISLLDDREVPVPETEIVEFEIQQTTSTAYSWKFPSMTREVTGAFQLYQAWSWDGWLPNGFTLNVKFNKESAFVGTELATIKVFFIRVPRRTILPR